MAINPRDRHQVNRPPPQQTQAILAGLFIIGFAYLLGSWWAAVFLAIAVAWHEYGHVRAFRQTGRPDATFYLIPFIGGVATSRHPHENDQDAAYVALMGPGFSLLLLLICAVFYEWAINTKDLFWAQAAGRVGYLMTLIGALNLLNLAPLWPLDGGHVFHALARFVAPNAARTATLISGAVVAGLAFVSGAVFIGVFAAMMVAQGASSPNLYLNRPPLRRRQAIVLGLAYAACLIAHFWAGRWQLMGFLPQWVFV